MDVGGDKSIEGQEKCCILWLLWWVDQEGEDQPNFMFIKVSVAGLSVQLDTTPIGSLQRSTLCLLRQRQTGKINIRQNVCKLLNCGQKSLLLIPTRVASLFRLSLLFKEILSQWVHWFYQRRSGIRKNPTKRSKISFDFGDILLFYRLNVPLSEPAGQFRFETNNNNWHHQARNFTCSIAQYY